MDDPALPSTQAGAGQGVSTCATAGLLAAAVGVVIACAGCGSVASHDPPTTRAQSVDRAATSDYLRAREALLRSSQADLAAGQGPMSAFVARVGAECPGSLRGTPLDQRLPDHPSSAQTLAILSNHNLTAALERGLEKAEQEPQAAALARFVKTVDALRWSDPRITYLVKRFMQIELQRRHSESHVCRDIREWVASGYRKVPSPTSGQPTSYEAHGAIAHRWTLAAAALGCGRAAPPIPMVVLRAIEHYQQRGARPTGRDLEVLEWQIYFEGLRASTDAARSLTEMLGISRAVTEQRLPQRRSRKPPRLSPHALALQIRLPPQARERCTGKPDSLVDPPDRVERFPLK